MSKNELEKMVGMNQEEYMQQNPDHIPMFPKDWANDQNWPDITYDYDSFRKTQIEIDDYRERMAGC